MDSKIRNGRKLSIYAVSKDTGISRQTLTALYKGTAKAVEFNTINRLVKYFDIEISDLIKYKKDSKGKIVIGIYSCEDNCNKDSFKRIKKELNENKDMNRILNDQVGKKIPNYNNGLRLFLNKDNEPLKDSRSFVIDVSFDEFINGKTSKGRLINVAIIPAITNDMAHNVVLFQKERNKLTNYLKNMAEEKVLYIYTKAMLCSGLLDNLEDNDKLAFVLPSEFKIKYMTKEKIKEYVYKSYNSLKKYDYKDKGLDYTVIDYTKRELDNKI